MSEVAELKRQIEELKQRLASATSASTGSSSTPVVKREKITTMSSEVVDSNPYRYGLIKAYSVYEIYTLYIFFLFHSHFLLFSSSSSRLMALKRMGIVDNYEVYIYVYIYIYAHTLSLLISSVGMINI